MGSESDVLSLCHPCILSTASLGECVACVFGQDIRVFNFDNASKPIRILSGHGDPIIYICCHPLQPTLLLSIDATGHVIVWDIFAGSSVSKVSLGVPFIFARATTDGVITIERKQAHGKLRMYPWSRNRKIPQQRPKIKEPCQLHPKCSTEAIDVGCENRLVVMIAHDLKIAVYNMKNPAKPSCIQIPNRFLVRPDVRLTALALHPRLDHMAGGLSSGVIVLWRCGLHQRKKLPKNWVKRKKSKKGEEDEEEEDEEEKEEEEEENAASIITRLHWHPLAVRCLAFSGNGAFLLSGGHEAVLVKWDLTGGASSSRRRTLLPRLRAPITAVGAASPRHAFALLSDRCLVLLAGAAFDVSLVVQGRLLRAAPPLPRELRGACRHHLTGLVLDPGSGAVLASARPGHLQWLPSGGNSDVLDVLDVTEENYVPLEPQVGGEPTESCATEVLLAAFSRNGDVLATYEALPIGESHRCLRRVKWWLREAGGGWRLGHCANAGHHTALLALAFAPASKDLVAVTGNAGVAWSAMDDGEAWSERFVWRTHGFFGGSAACSFHPTAEPDLLAVARADVLTLWRWPESAAALSPVLLRRTSLPSALVQLCWPPGGPLFGRLRPSGNIVAWHITEQGEVRSAEQCAEQSEDQKGAEQIMEQCAEHSTEKGAEQSTDHSMEVCADHSMEQCAEQSIVQCEEPGADQGTEHVASLGKPAFHLKIHATALAVHGEWVAACTGDKSCLLLHRDTGATLRSLPLTAPLCCAAVTPSGVILGLGDRPERLERLCTAPEQQNGVAGEEVAPVDVSRRPAGLLGKLEALAAQEAGLKPAAGPGDGAVRMRQRLAEAAATRIRERVEEFVGSTAACAPDLEQLALATLRLQTELELQSPT